MVVMYVMPADCPGTPAPDAISNGTWKCAVPSTLNGLQCLATCDMGFEGRPSAVCIGPDWGNVTGSCRPTGDAQLSNNLKLLISLHYYVYHYMETKPRRLQRAFSTGNNNICQ
jgi:hypothetical protein